MTYEAPVPVSELEEGTVAAVEGCVFGSVQVSPNRKLQTVSAPDPGSDGNFESPLVPDAVSAQYAPVRKPDYCQRQGGE